MREMIEEVGHGDNPNIWKEELSAMGFSFVYRGGYQRYTLHLETSVDIDRFASDLLLVWGNLIGKYINDQIYPVLSGNIIMGYWKDTMNPVYMMICERYIDIMVNRDHSDLPVYSLLENIRRYVAPCARLVNTYGV